MNIEQQTPAGDMIEIGAAVARIQTAYERGLRSAFEVAVDGTADPLIQSQLRAVAGQLAPILTQAVTPLLTAIRDSMLVQRGLVEQLDAALETIRLLRTDIGGGGRVN